MKKVRIILGAFILIYSCTTVPITGRQRVNLVSDSQILPSSFAMYSGFLKDNKISKNIAKTNEIRQIGGRISKAVDKFMRANGMQAEADSYKWEFNLIEDKAMNAWCLPGGKVVFYEGILPICANADGIAAVMGHEIAHAFAKHGQERMTAGYAQQLGGIAVAIGTSNDDPKKQAIWQTVYGLGSTVGMLKYSRVHETEADKLGMVFMIMAGYKPEEAVNVWIRMSEKSNNSIPEFLSTHPSHQTRIQDLKAYMPTAISMAAKYNSK